MLVKSNYEECITNIACSILKYFDSDYHNNTIKEIDEVLERRKPKNVVLILYDGMGNNILNRNLDENSFLRKHFVKEITSVTPATTTAATTSILSGLNPNEHCWLGWDNYVKPIDKIVTMYLNTIKDTEISAANYNVCRKYFPYKEIFDNINEHGYYAKGIFPFGDDFYTTIDDMNDRIIKECSKDGKKYIYAYYENPDEIMHETGTDSLETLNVFDLINKTTEELCSKLGDDTVVIVTADHGHINSIPVILKDYPDFLNTLDGNIWIEGRCCSFKVKEGKNKEFESLFNKYFSNDFVLKTKEEMINEKVFGPKNDGEMFYSCLGDYFALACSSKYFRYDSNSGIFKSTHAGFTSDEMMIPIIIVEK